MNTCGSKAFIPRSSLSCRHGPTTPNWLERPPSFGHFEPKRRLAHMGGVEHVVDWVPGDIGKPTGLGKFFKAHREPAHELPRLPAIVGAKDAFGARNHNT